MHTTKSLSSLLLLATTFLVSQIPSAGANPLPRAPSIPPAPADPKKPAGGDGIGPYKSQSPGIGDRLDKAKFYTIAVTAGELNLVNAERGMRHYLGNSGDELNVTPQSMMKGLPKFRDSVKAMAQNEATATYNSISGATGEKAFSSSWEVFTATKAMSWDWYFAIGSFSYSVTGVVTKTKDGGSLKYRVHIFDRYNWDQGKSVDIGPFHFEDKELGNLHLKGLAREYTVRGSSGVNEVDKFKPGTVIPPPSTGGRG
ncbi:Uncharacterized protein BP5553_01069 [Venustampulla echinocandica]|uniref:Uncharacterized protein n=1 Tax=Venustampulla echinocandica TaxID=2656787 RepID=A0A370TZZ0_9HELO|nr:Uncharacterized protein BP5553_01069 [Venustampulla echinocandica]RDL41090.1 Uncharacterized protein BP5553_01069 [Venustampulla echinocandica]